jgi:AAA15 family ATPase/GTPase
MQKVEPRLKRLRYAKLPGTTSPLVFVDIGLSRAVPATQMGQAFNRILHIYSNILANQTNVLLVDEIENGIFSDSLPMIWKGLLEICESEGVQIFATTHSRECVMAAHNAAKERGKDELSVQRLQLVKGQVEAVHLGDEHLELASEMGLEVRA